MDPDQLVSEKPADLDLHRSSKKDVFMFSMVRDKKSFGSVNEND